ncbi:MAG: hypothetical protein H7A25_23905 [Leptospiraceae bacterium]|nr:hypothetical protein [Leptospiraceae bacterium]
MSVEIRVTSEFTKNAKRLIKKFPSLKNELKELQEELKENPKMGIRIRENVYKIRLAVKSKGKGKSGGMRVITYVDLEIKNENNITIVFLLTIYDKSESENIDDHEIEKAIEDLDE